MSKKYMGSLVRGPKTGEWSKVWMLIDHIPCYSFAYYVRYVSNKYHFPVSCVFLISNH